MLENIALIHEVHNHTPVHLAQKEAMEYLIKIESEHIAYKRMHQCNDIELFCIMVIRALMTKEKNIVLLNPLAILKNTEFLKQARETLSILNDEKNIIILENEINRFYYEGMKALDDIQ